MLKGIENYRISILESEVIRTILNTLLIGSAEVLMIQLIASLTKLLNIWKIPRPVHAFKSLIFSLPLENSKKEEQNIMLWSNHVDFVCSRLQQRLYFIT